MQNHVEIVLLSKEAFSVALPPGISKTKNSKLLLVFLNKYTNLYKLMFIFQGNKCYPYFVHIFL